MSAFKTGDIDSTSTRVEIETETDPKSDVLQEYDR